MWWRLGLVAAMVPLSVATAATPPQRTCVPLRVLRVTTYADGGHAYHLEGGATTFVPPRDFDPATASAEQFTRYHVGFSREELRNYRWTPFSPPCTEPWSGVRYVGP